MLGGVRKSEILAGDGPLADFHRRLVDVVCPECGERLGQVTDEPDGPELTVWAPTVMVRQDRGGEPLWTVAAGPLPLDQPDAVVAVYCFGHGPSAVTVADLLHSLARYKSTGRRQRVRAAITP